MSEGLTKEDIQLRNFFNNSYEDFFKNYNALQKIKSNEDKINFIEERLFESNYPQKLKPYVKTLYAYMETENLFNLANNLSTVKLKRINPFRWLLLDKIMGSFDFYNNRITYLNKNSIPHELMHLSSTINNSRSGFNLIKTGYNYGSGLNEGYTEMLSQRIFFNENYQKSAYKTDVYLTRLFELLYDNPKQMENAYFSADYINPLETFLRYGSLKEYKYFLKHLDYFAMTDIWENEEIETFDFITNIVERTNNVSKIKKAYNIYDEYVETEKKLKN